MNAIKKFLKLIDENPNVEFQEKIDYEAAYKQTFWDATITFTDINLSFNKRYYITNGKIDTLDEDKRGEFFIKFIKDLHLFTINKVFDDYINLIENSNETVLKCSAVIDILNSLKKSVEKLYEEIFNL